MGRSSLSLGPWPGGGAAIIDGEFVQGQTLAVADNENVIDNRYSLCAKVNKIYLKCDNKSLSTLNMEPCWQHVQKVLGKNNPFLWFPDPTYHPTLGDLVKGVLSYYWHAAANIATFPYHHPLDFIIPGKLEEDIAMHFYHHPDQIILAAASIIAPEADASLAAADGADVTAGSLGELATATEDGSLAEAFHYTTSESISGIEEEGLWPGAYVTPNGDLSPTQAHIDLALDPAGGPRNALIQIDLKAMREDGYVIPKIERIGRAYRMPGGGWQMLFKDPIPTKYLTVIRR